MIATRTTIGLMLLAFALPAFAREYDAETDIGLVAENMTPQVAQKNTVLLTAALNAQWLGGKFRFVDGHTGPVLNPIRCSGKEFFFAGTIKTAAKIGCELHGMGRSYSIASGAYIVNGQGGAVTRFTRIDGGNTANGEVAILRLRGAGAVVEGIEFRGQAYNYDPTGGGPGEPTSQPAGIRTPVAIEVESRNGVPTTTKHLIRNCLFADCGVGIYSRACYYDDKGQQVADESHADLGSVSDCDWTGCDSCYKSENQQSVCWRFNNLIVSGRGWKPPVTVFDILRGGDVTCNGLTLDHSAATIFRVRDYSQHTARLVCNDMKWDRGTATADDGQGHPYYLTLFQYDGPVGYDISFARWSVRVTGNISNSDPASPAYHAERLLSIPPGCGLPTDDLLFDISRLPTAGFVSAGGPWVRPKP